MLEEQRMHRVQEEVRKAASNMTLDAARKMLKEGGPAAAELVSLVDQHLLDAKTDPVPAPQLRHPTQALVQKSSTASVANAKKMLNNMINENVKKLDQLHIECSSFFKKQCSLMETCRSELASANSEAAHWRGQVLHNQRCINLCEFRLPQLKGELQMEIIECNKRLGYLRRDLKVVLGDIEVMEKVLELTECHSKAPELIQTPSIVECKHPCTKQSFLAFQHEQLNERLAQFKSSRMRQLVQQGLEELAVPMPTVPRDKNGKVIVNVTAFKNPPLEQEQLPADPCEGISYDAGGEAGCTLRTNPNCFNLQNKFINIQGEIVDKRDALLGQIRDLDASCRITQEELSASISRFESRQDGCSAGLAQGTGEENEAEKEAKAKGQEHHTLEVAMLQSRTECTNNMRQFESELCALRKIRGEISKVKQDTHIFFQDCEVSDWNTEECTKSCGGGIQYLRRSVRGGGSHRAH